MSRKRIIPKFLLEDGRLVKYTRFHDNRREAGNPVTTAKIYNDYGVDELIILDIKPTKDSRAATLAIIEKISEQVFMPLTVGGGVASLQDIRDLLNAGADKVSINTAATLDPDFIEQAAAAFGNQCITLSVDYVTDPNWVMCHGGRVRAMLRPIPWASKMSRYCGEVLFTSIERDGTMSGFDLMGIDMLDQCCDVPIIASGGCGGLHDCIAAFEAGADAVAISSLFLFTDHSPIKLRSHLVSNGIDVRASKSSRN